MERVPSQASQPQFLPARTYRPSAASTSSRFRRPTQDPKSTATSPNPALKTFVVPLFFSNSSVQNDTSAHGALPASTRSRASTRSVIEDAVTGADGVRPLSVPRDSQSEYSDMYGGSLHQPERPEPVPLARNMDDEPTPSERQALRAYQSRSSTRSSRRSSKKHGVFSRKSYRDPDVSSKARISFAFGVTLVVALVLCELSSSASCQTIAHTDRFGSGLNRRCEEPDLSCDIDSFLARFDRSILPPAHSHVHAYPKPKRIQTSHNACS